MKVFFNYWPTEFIVIPTFGLLHERNKKSFGIEFGWMWFSITISNKKVDYWE